MSARREPSRNRWSGLALALVCVLAPCMWSQAMSADARKDAADPAQTPGIHETPDGFTVVEDAQADAGTLAAFARAIQLLQQQNYTEGAAALTQITEQSPGLVAAHIDLGIALSRAGDLDKAEASLKRALELDPRHPVAWNELGMVQRRKGQFAEARAAYEKALEIAPDFRFARLNLAILCDLYTADADCALQNYLTYEQAVPEDHQVAIWIADLRSRTGHKE